ncbi:MAG: hypothetical protein OHK0046_21250 [Anaerolineae bacterium]
MVLIAVLMPTLVAVFVRSNLDRRTLEADLAQELNILARAEAQAVQTALAAQMDLLLNLSNLDQIESFVRLVNASRTGENIQEELLVLDAQWQSAVAVDDYTLPLIANTVSNSVSEELRRFQENIPANTEIFVTDALGVVIAATNPISDYYQADEDWWQAAFNGGVGNTYIAESFAFDESVGAEVLVMAMPIQISDRFAGVLRTNFTVTGLKQLIDNTDFGATGRSKMMTFDGTVLVSSDAARGAVLPEVAVFFPMEDEDLHFAVDESGEEVVVGDARVTTGGRWPVVDNLNWHLVFLQSADEALAPIQQSLNADLITAAAITLASLLIVYLFTRTITAPLQTLTAAAQDIGLNRNWSRRVEVGGSNEFAVLATAFNNMAAEVQNVLVTLEQRVAERTRDLETVADVSSQTSTILEVDRLLQDVVDLTKERFGLYHAHIYLLNTTGDSLVLAAGAGHVGRQMVGEQRSISLNNVASIVSRAASTRRGQIVNDVTKSDAFLPHPSLPNTRAELAVPLVARGQLLGVLDVQSDKIGYFRAEVLSIMELMASQIATAISNARLFESTEQTSRHEAAIGEITRRLQGAANIEEILQTAVRELGKALRVPHTAIALQLAPDVPDDEDSLEQAEEQPPIEANGHRDYEVTTG